jgi:cyanate permease
MVETKLTVADIILIAGTRVVLGAGIGLLLSSRLNNDQRKAAGLALALVGVLTTIPLAFGVIGRQRSSLSELRAA